MNFDWEFWSLEIGQIECIHLWLGAPGLPKMPKKRCEKRARKCDQICEQRLIFHYSAFELMPTPLSWLSLDLPSSNYRWAGEIGIGNFSVRQPKRPILYCSCDNERLPMLLLMLNDNYWCFHIGRPTRLSPFMNCPKSTWSNKGSQSSHSNC